MEQATSASSHRRRKRRRHRKKRYKLLHVALLAWSVITLVVFLQMLDSIDLVPFWQIVALSVSTLLGIGFALYVFYFAKK